MINEKESHCYDDIINLPHHISKRHPQMSLHDRAAQFSPFSALTGYDAAIDETARITDRKIELNEDTKEKLNERLVLIQEHSGERQIVTITYYVPDERKSGGTYISHRGIVKRIDSNMQTITMEDKTIIPMEQIYNIEGEIFQD